MPHTEIGAAGAISVEGPAPTGVARNFIARILSGTIARSRARNPDATRCAARACRRHSVERATAVRFGALVLRDQLTDRRRQIAVDQIGDGHELEH